MSRLFVRDVKKVIANEEYAPQNKLVVISSV